MKKIALVIIVGFLNISVFSQIFPASLAGRWTFDNLSNPLYATVGTNLLLNGSHIATSGYGPLDGAYLIGTGSYYTCSHGIAANGGGTTVNEYSIMFDFLAPEVTSYHCFYQTNMSNGNDGEVFISPTGNIGISSTGYSGISVPQNTWHRLVVAVDLGSSFKYYLDGHLILTGTSQAVDSRFSLDIPNVLFFADDNGEDNLIAVSQIAIFNACLTDAEVLGLGGLVQSNIKPYLQTPAPESMYISWNSYYTTTKVEYGTSAGLGSSENGSYESVNGVYWHTVKLTGLQPDTRYYYRCISGNDTSEIYPFRTPPLPGTAGKKQRFVILSDSQNEVAQSNKIADSVMTTLLNNYGTFWYDSISLFMHTGDITQSGSTIGRYMNEYFNTYARFSCSVPFMVAIGNHEVESSNYYKFIKYEDLSDFPLPNVLNEKYYSFFLGNSQFIILNTNGNYNNATQINWLNEKLVQSDTNIYCDFVFVMNHQPGHSEIWPDGNTAYVQNDVYNKLAQFNKVTLCSHGHSHNYERGLIQAVNNNRQDFWISIIGGAGGPLDRWGMYTNQTNYPEVQRSLDYYCFKLIEADGDINKCDAKMYSIGNLDKPFGITVMDQWHRYTVQPAPEKPVAYSPASVSTVTPELIASAFAGIDSLMSSRFQLVKSSGSFSSPILDILRDNENTYGVTSAPDYFPINLNAGIDLKRYNVPFGTVIIDTTYKWRVCYRDYNARWSEWSDSAVFTVVSSVTNNADFFADIISGDAPLTVNFTDVSVVNPTGWEWDFENDGTVDSYLRDPVNVYTIPGVYTVNLTAQTGAQQVSEIKQSYITVLDPMAIAINVKDDVFKIIPNPSSGFQSVIFSIEESSSVSIQIFDVNGIPVKTLADGKYIRGNHSIVWDGTGNNGQMLKSGFYYCRFVSNGKVSCLKLVRT